MDYQEDFANRNFVREIKEKDLTDKDALSMVEDFCRYMAGHMYSITKGCALANVYMKDRKNIIMTNVDQERILAHFAVMDAVFEKVSGQDPQLRETAAKAMDRGADHYMGFSQWKQFLENGSK